jgi:hypothetical protein
MENAARIEKHGMRINFGWKSARKRLFARPSLRWEDSIEYVCGEYPDELI